MVRFARATHHSIRNIPKFPTHTRMLSSEVYGFFYFRKTVPPPYLPVLDRASLYLKNVFLTLYFDKYLIFWQTLVVGGRKGLKESKSRLVSILATGGARNLSKFSCAPFLRFFPLFLRIVEISEKFSTFSFFLSFSISHYKGLWKYAILTPRDVHKHERPKNGLLATAMQHTVNLGVKFWKLSKIYT